MSDKIIVLRVILEHIIYYLVPNLSMRILLLTLMPIFIPVSISTAYGGSESSYFEQKYIVPFYTLDMFIIAEANQICIQS